MIRAMALVLTLANLFWAADSLLAQQDPAVTAPAQLPTGETDTPGAGSETTPTLVSPGADTNPSDVRQVNPTEQMTRTTVPESEQPLDEALSPARPSAAPDESDSVSIRIPNGQNIHLSDNITPALNGMEGISPLFWQPAPAGTGLHFGPATVHLALSSGFVASTQRSNQSGNAVGVSGAFSGVTQPQSRIEGVYGTLSATAGLELGEQTADRLLTLQDTFTLAYPSEAGSVRDYDQQILLQGKYRLTRLELGTEASYMQSSGLSRDAGGDANRQLVSLGLSSRYAASPNTSLEWNTTLSDRQFSGRTSSRGIDSTAALDLTCSPKLTLGLGITAGTVSVQSAAEQYYEQASVRVAYAPTEKLAFFAIAGPEFRSSGSHHSISPVFSVSGAWTPRVGATIGLSASETIYNSAEVANSNYRSTTVSLTASQNLLEKYTLAAVLSYENAEYESVATGGNSSRLDNLVTGELSLTANLTDRVTAGLSLGAGRNWSNAAPFHFLQTAFRVSYFF